jgi:hypothetical protein
MSDEIEQNDEGHIALDEKAARDDIAAGARALKELKRTAGHNWIGWSAAVRGWRGLRELAFLRAGTRDTKTQAYRDAMTHQLGLVKNFEYRDIEKETRSAMTRLIQHIDEIDAWHATLSVWERERWTNPQTIVKHAPKHLLVGQTHNQPKRKAKGPKKKKGNPEAESLRAILIRIIIKYVQPVDPDEAKTLLENLYAGATDPDDGLDDLGVDGLDEAESADD